jgi:hypothetical protein
VAQRVVFDVSRRPGRVRTAVAWGWLRRRSCVSFDTMSSQQGHGSQGARAGCPVLWPPRSAALPHPTVTLASAGALPHAAHPNAASPWRCAAPVRWQRAGESWAASGIVSTTSVLQPSPRSRIFTKQLSTQHLAISWSVATLWHHIQQQPVLHRLQDSSCGRTHCSDCTSRLGRCPRVGPHPHRRLAHCSRSGRRRCSCHAAARSTATCCSNLQRPTCTRWRAQTSARDGRWDSKLRALC